jgi:hypothetical protein
MCSRSVLWGYGTRDNYENEFVEFLVDKRDIDTQKARILVANPNKLFSGGWGGNVYRRFTELALETFRPLYDDAADALIMETYRFHVAFDFLRMLSYAIPTVQDVGPIVSRLSTRPSVQIVDYGCGLANRAIAVSRYLIAQGVKVKLYLLDIRRELHFSFLNSLCRKYEIDSEFIEVTQNNLYPELPPHDYCDNVSVLEMFVSR